MTLTQKESGLLCDLKKQEQICIEKYSKYSNDACDPQLKNLFNQIEQQERQHLDTINQLASGTIPAMNAGGGGSKVQVPQTAGNMSPECKQNDTYLCSDILSTEKHVSATYNTCIFEFSDPGVRNALNHLQKEEQQHGEHVYKYMSINGMY